MEMAKALSDFFQNDWASLVWTAVGSAASHSRASRDGQPSNLEDFCCSTAQNHLLLGRVQVKFLDYVNRLGITNVIAIVAASTILTLIVIPVIYECGVAGRCSRPHHLPEQNKKVDQWCGLP